MPANRVAWFADAYFTSPNTALHASRRLCLDRVLFYFPPGNFDVFCLQPNGRVSRTTVQDLIPFAFSKAELVRGAGKADS